MEGNEVGIFSKAPDWIPKIKAQAAQTKNNNLQAHSSEYQGIS